MDFYVQTRSRLKSVFSLDQIQYRFKSGQSLDESQKYFLNFSRLSPDHDLVPDLSLDSVWTDFENIFLISSRLCPDSNLVSIWSRPNPDMSLDKKKSRLWTDSGLVSVMNISGPEHDKSPYESRIDLLIPVSSIEYN